MRTPRLTKSETKISIAFVLATLVVFSGFPIVRAILIDPSSLPGRSTWGTSLDINLDEQLAKLPTPSHPSNAVLVISIADDKSFFIRDLWGLAIGKVSGFTTRIEIAGKPTQYRATWVGGAVALRTEPNDFIAPALEIPIPASNIQVRFSFLRIALSVFLSIALGIAGVAAGICAFRAPRARRTQLVKRRLSNRLCPACGYPLLADPKLATGTVCSECGWKASSIH